MRIHSVLSTVLAGALLMQGVQAAPAAPDNGPALRAVYLDKSGVIRWRDNKEEVALYGANYCVMSGSDYRMAGLVGADRKAMIDEDMAQFARMGWTALRLCSWGDWENSDRAGNLLVNEHVDLLDYLIAKARERGIYILLTPIHTYNPAFADQMDQPTQNSGFSRYFERPEMGTNAASIAAQANYIRQLLRHVNPYTGVAIKDEPAILFVEMINEPVHHPEDLSGSIKYINTLVNAVRASGSHQLTFFNVSQDFAIAPAIKASKVDGASFGWYPTSLVAGHMLKGNFLPAVDGYPDMLRPDLAGRPRIVYEFDQADLISGYMYPAMARTFRSVGTQLATMFAYDMLQTAPFNLGWQTHFLNLVHTPRKAVSAVIAAEAMRRLPRMKSYGRYPDSESFGDFRVSYEGDRSELNAADAFMYAGDTADAARDSGALQRIVGFGSSGTVDYEGTGAYFLDKLRDGMWRLELYPDEVLVRDPFEQPQPGKVVSRLLYRSWPMKLQLPDLGADFTATPLNVPGAPSAARTAASGAIAVEPGVWLLTRERADASGVLPARVGRVALKEFHVNARVSYPDFVQTLAPREFMAGAPVEIRVRVANEALPDEVRLWVRPAGAGFSGKPIAMHRVRGNDYGADLPAEYLAPGLYEYAASTRSGDRVTTFPGGVPRQPFEWPFRLDSVWSFSVTPAGTTMRLFNPRVDYDRLSFVRPGEQYRSPFFRLTPGESADEMALTLNLPDLGRDTPERYAAALYIGDAMAVRQSELANAAALHIKLRAEGGSRKTLQLALIEEDGTAWGTAVRATGAWESVTVPLSSLVLTRSIHIPSPYPGLWNYWRDAAQGRGGPADHVHIDHVERLQLTVTPNVGDTADDTAKGASVESITLSFATGASAAEPEPTAGKTWTLPLAGTAAVHMAWIPPGEFLMGSPPSEALRRADEGPVTRVTLRQGYWLGTTLVTIGQWKAVTGRGVREQLLGALRDDTLYDFGGSRQTLRAYMHFSSEVDPGRYLTGEAEDLPMYYVSWQAAVSFCRALNARERAAGRLPPEYEYALPTEAQWEYASRAGSTTASYAGALVMRDQRAPVLDGIAWYEANSASGYVGRGWLINGRQAGPHAVAGKHPNAWGLYDMAGNLWEWCRDWYGPYPGGHVTDPAGPLSGVARINRGGSFGSGAADERSAARASNPPAEASAFRGFRLALVAR